MLAIQGKRKVVLVIDLNYLSRRYFYFDEPVEFELKDKNKIFIYPVSLKDSEIFLSSISILNIDKNSSSSVEIIQMSYLKFLYMLISKEPNAIQQFLNILMLCLKLKTPEIIWENEKNPTIYDPSLEIKINHNDFEDIRRIILYQNILNFDDEYIDPDLKKSIDKFEELKNRNVEIPNLERKMAIITTRTGIKKKEQENMTYRSHCLLFEEVCAEVEFTTTRAALLFAGSKEPQEHWIYKNKKNKLDKYITYIDDYTKSMGINEKSIKSAIVDSKDFANDYAQKLITKK